jgi:hypothetical protein
VTADVLDDRTLNRATLARQLLLERADLDPLAAVEHLVGLQAQEPPVAAWSRLTGLREVIDRLADRLRPFRSESGRELWDLPDAARPDPDTPAPVRFLPEYDNVPLSHDDRTRFGHRPGWDVPPPVKGTVLVDGVVRGVWHPVDEGLVVRTFGSLAKRATGSVEAEGRRLLRFLEADGREVRVSTLD